MLSVWRLHEDWGNVASKKSTVSWVSRLTTCEIWTLRLITSSGLSSVPSTILWIPRYWFRRFNSWRHSLMFVPSNFGTPSTDFRESSCTWCSAMTFVNQKRKTWAHNLLDLVAEHIVLLIRLLNTSTYKYIYINTSIWDNLTTRERQEEGRHLA